MFTQTFWRPHISCPNFALADNKTNIYFEDIALDRESQMLYLTSKTEGSILHVKANMEEEEEVKANMVEEEEVKANMETIGLKVFLSTNASRPTGIAVDPCSRLDSCCFKNFR